MAVSADICKELDSFRLDIHFRSSARRIGILGASGCGKSMTLKSIAGIVTPDEGHIEIGGRVLFDTGKPGKKAAKRVNLKPRMRNVGYLFQNYALFPTMTVEQNIAAGLKGSRREKEKRVRQMVEKFRLEGLEKRLPGRLSGGQQQRVALARIMAYEPEVILLDEPFSALDMFLKDQLQRELMEMLEDYRGTVIMVSHNRDEIYRFSEEVIVIDSGKIVAAGPTEELFKNPVSREAARLTGCKNFSRIIRVDAHTVQASDWGVTLELGREVPEDASWIGYRAHDFIPVWGERGKNMIPFDLADSAALPFERNYYIRPESARDDAIRTGVPRDDTIRTGVPRGDAVRASGLRSDVICWFVQREKLQVLEERGMPDYLAFDEDAVLFLQ